MTYSEHILKCLECGNDPLNHRCEVGETLLHGTRVIETEKSIEVVPTFSVTSDEWLMCELCEDTEAIDKIRIRHDWTAVCSACRARLADRVDEGNHDEREARQEHAYEVWKERRLYI
jgi:hypothetical protein